METTKTIDGTTAANVRISDLHTGDLVQLRWMGDRAVPNREGQAWATVRAYLPPTGKFGPRVEVTVDSYGTTRRITTEYIERWDRKICRNAYELAGRRVPSYAGSRLAKVAQ